MRLSELLQATGFLRAESEFKSKTDPAITGVEFDSRRVEPGHLFVAIKGHKQDGHEFISQALENGAVAVVRSNNWARQKPDDIPHVICDDGRTALAELSNVFYGQPTKSLFSVGITGTKGKSSVAHMSAEVLGRGETALISTITNALERGVEQTTPEANIVQRIAREAVDSGLKNLVVESSAHALSQQRVRAVDLNAAVFTNLSHDHFDYFKNWEEYLAAKLILFQNLPESGTAIVNLDDSMSEKFIAITNANVLTYSTSRAASIRANRIELSPNGSSFELETPMGQFELNLKMPGSFYVENALAVVGVGIAAGLDLDTIKARLEHVRHIEGRFERYKSPKGFSVVIDFAHSPDSLDRMLTTLNGFYERVITVFGCGGDSDRAKRPEMGRISGELSSFTVVTNDNPKHEDPGEILKEIESGLAQTAAQYELIEDRRAAIDRAVSLARSGDVLFIAGKGHERKQSFAGYEVDFNDRDYLVERGIIELKANSNIEYTSAKA